MTIEKLAIIIPAYNEEKRIGYTLEKYSSFFKNLKKKKIIDYEIMIVINNTHDKTEDIVKKYMKHDKNIKFLNLKPGGKGFAIIEGFKYAIQKDFSLIGFVDADCSTMPEAFYDLAKNIEKNYAIIASRQAKGAIVKPRQPFNRRFVSRAFNLIIRALFLMPYKDTQCGAKIFRKEALKQIIPKLGMTQWGIDIDLLYHLRKMRFSIKEQPTIWSDKGASTLNIKKASIQMFFAVIQLRLLNSPIKGLWRPISPIAGLLWRIVK